jgi:type II secretory pathway pseudopilin PulG
MSGSKIRTRMAASTTRPGGFTYVTVLFAVAVTGIGLASVGQVWRTVQQRDKETQLLFVGDQFRRAIGSFYEYPAAEKRYPRSLDELLQDPRNPNLVRHLRRIYGDPMTGKSEWGLVTAPDGQIVGVFSLSALEPIRRHGFADGYQAFSGALQYSDWKFVYTGGQAVAAGGPGAAGAGVPGDDLPAPAAVPPPATGAPDSGSRNECFAGRVQDLAACQAISASGNAGAAAACIGSAQMRLSACLRGAPQPPLRTTAR